MGFLAGCAAATLLSCGQTGQPRLVMLIVIDTLRADHLGCYGYGPIHTPHLDSLAAGGMLYESAVTAAPITLPAVATILTGAYPLQHGIRDNGGFRLNDAWVTLAERMRAAGYVTAAFVSSEVLAGSHNLTQGFDVYDDDLSQRLTFFDARIKHLEDVRQGTERRAGDTVDRALGWLDSVAGDEAFLFVHIFDPHVPRDPPPPFDRAYAGRPYDGEIAFTDREIGRLLAGAARRWRPEQILAAVVADHGEGLGDHEEELHGVLLYEETVRVPLILSGPGVPRGRRVTDLARTADVAPTLCALTGLEGSSASVGAVLPGLDARGRHAAPAAPAPAAYLETLRPRLAHNWCELRALRTREWKLIEGARIELYDLRADPGERHDLAADRGEVRDSLLALLDATGFASHARGAHAADLDVLSEEERENLLSLGYVTGAQAVASPADDSLAVWGFPPAERGRAVALRDPGPGLRAYNQSLEARSYVKAGGAAYRSGDFAYAAQLFREALAADPSSADAHLGLACALEQAGHGPAALALLRQAHAAFPDHALITAALARRLAESGRGAETRALAKPAAGERKTPAAGLRRHEDPDMGR